MVYNTERFRFFGHFEDRQFPIVFTKLKRTKYELKKRNISLTQDPTGSCDVMCIFL